MGMMLLREVRWFVHVRLFREGSKKGGYLYRHSFEELLGCTFKRRS